MPYIAFCRARHARSRCGMPVRARPHSPVSSRPVSRTLNKHQPNVWCSAASFADRARMVAVRSERAFIWLLMRSSFLMYSGMLAKTSSTSFARSLSTFCARIVSRSLRWHSSSFSSCAAARAAQSMAVATGRQPGARVTRSAQVPRAASDGRTKGGQRFHARGIVLLGSAAR